jgi:hypothetical protein
MANTGFPDISILLSMRRPWGGLISVRRGIYGRKPEGDVKGQKTGPGEFLGCGRRMLQAIAFRG